MSDVVPEEKKSVRIVGKNGRILAMDESFNPVSTKVTNSSINHYSVKPASSKNNDKSLYMSAASPKSSDHIEKDVFFIRDRASFVGPRSSRYFQPDSLSSQFSESENDYWSNYRDRASRSSFRDELDVPTLSSSQQARVESPTLISASDHERSLTTYEHLHTIQSTSQNCFDPNFKYPFTNTSIYYIRPAFTKRIPHPKTMSPTQTLITNRDKTNTHRENTNTNTLVTKRDKTDTNDNTNWVLLPASWGPTSKGFLEPLETEAKSGETQNTRIGLWVKLKGGQSS